MNVNEPMKPLRFLPIFQRYLWGGRRLHSVLGKSIGDKTAAESWEIVDHGDHQSVVAGGPMAGQTLRQLIADHGADLLGESVMKAVAADGLPDHLRLRFPLLLKFLDANQNLSVQVHPNDHYAATLDPPDLGKTEAWYVMHADPGSRIYAGLKQGVTQSDFQQAVDSGQTESVLHSFEPQAGDCVFIKAGTMHALGAGLLIAEIQQASNTTFRVFDWNRVGTDGQPRPLHIQQAMEVTDFSRGPVDVAKPTPAKAGWSNLVSCDQFILNKAQTDQPVMVGGDGRFHILAVTKGKLDLENDPLGKPLATGDTALIPAAAGETTIRPREAAEFLEIHVE